MQSQLQAASAPLNVATVKQGSTYKSAISKPPTLHADRRALMQVWADDLVLPKGVRVATSAQKTKALTF